MEIDRVKPTKKVSLRPLIGAALGLNLALAVATAYRVYTPEQPPVEPDPIAIPTEPDPIAIPTEPGPHTEQYSRHIVHVMNSEADDLTNPSLRARFRSLVQQIDFYCTILQFNRDSVSEIRAPRNSYLVTQEEYCLNSIFNSYSPESTR